MEGNEVNFMKYNIGIVLFVFNLKCACRLIMISNNLIISKSQMKMRQEKFQECTRKVDKESVRCGRCSCK
ncbi:hypothetical protein FHS90_004390 [Rufibacter quisquiliarum]|uniref:Uncharacterized protein n=1 Tax=Rufibacter quisquiliarum TaxID=1549639 RepID=A0A839H174_9BACT|nr:hypothetical protein [Rufibacter quisquiliarum]